MTLRGLPSSSRRRAHSAVGCAAELSSELATCAGHAGARAAGPPRGAGRGLGRGAAECDAGRALQTGSSTALRRLPPLAAGWRALVEFARATTSAASARSRWRRCRRNCAARRDAARQALATLDKRPSRRRAVPPPRAARAQRRPDQRAGALARIARRARRTAGGLLLRRHRQRQDRGLSARRASAAGARPARAGAGAGARDQPDAAAARRASRDRFAGRASSPCTAA